VLPRQIRTSACLRPRVDAQITPFGTALADDPDGQAADQNGGSRAQRVNSPGAFAVAGIRQRPMRRAAKLVGWMT
jgi:riboflavin biosynthesis pyrimidine reductase